MNQASAHLRVRSPRVSSSTLRRELAEQYSDLPEQSVATALDQATRAATALLNNTDDTASGNPELVAMLARDRLNAQRERRAAAARRIERGHRSRYGQGAR
jgi:hypothetical protein